jgi:acyl carrier protein
MERADVWELVRDKAQAVFGDQPVDEQTPLADLDSLGVVELAMDLEDATGATLDKTDVTGTVGDLLDLVAARAGKTEP